MAKKAPEPKKASKPDRAEKTEKAEKKAEKVAKPDTKAEGDGEAPPEEPKAKKGRSGGARARAPKKSAPSAPSPLAPREVATASATPELDALAANVTADGGAVLARYREPYGGRTVLLVALPLEKVRPTPYQRDVSPAHVKKLSRSIEKVGRFLDPVLAVRHGDTYWVPNGGHRLEALKASGATTVVALLIPEPEVAHKILALNTEKAHALKERALEVIRLERALAQAGDSRPESAFDVELEEGALLTLGLAYEKRPKLSGGAYSSLLRKTDPLVDRPLPDALARRERLCERLLEADDLVTKIVERLKERGFKSSFLRTFVVARVNPVGRFAHGDAPASAEEALDKLVANAKGFDVESVREQDLAAMGGGPPAEEGEGDE